MTKFDRRSVIGMWIGIGVMMEMTLIAEMMMNIRMMKIKRKRPIVVMTGITTAKGGATRINAPRIIEAGRPNHECMEVTESPITSSPATTIWRMTNASPE